MNVLKIGGSRGIDVAAAVENIAQHSERWVIVHGASAEADSLGERMGVPPRWLHSAEGHRSRYNDSETIRIFAMAAAAINQRITAALRAAGVDAIGLASAHLVHAERKRAIRARVRGRPVVVRDDYSGRITGVDVGLLDTLLGAGRVPVVAPLALSPAGDILNVDGDLAAASIAAALGAQIFLMLSNVPGLLRDPDDPATLIKRVRRTEEVEQVAQGRMIRKLHAAERSQVPHVIIADGRLKHPIDAALAGGGTHIVREGTHA